jgi:hypothetical protein
LEQLEDNLALEGLSNAETHLDERKFKITTILKNTEVIDSIKRFNPSENQKILENTDEGLFDSKAPFVRRNEDVFIFSTSSNILDKLTITKEEISQIDLQKEEEHVESTAVDLLKKEQNKEKFKYTFNLEQLIDMNERFIRDKLKFKIIDGQLYYTKKALSQQEIRERNIEKAKLEEKQSALLEVLSKSRKSKFSDEAECSKNASYRKLTKKLTTQGSSTNLVRNSMRPGVRNRTGIYGNVRSRARGEFQAKQKFIGRINPLDPNSPSDTLKYSFDLYSGFMGNLDLGGIVDFTVSSTGRTVFVLTKSGEIHMFAQANGRYSGVYDLSKASVEEKFGDFEKKLGLRKSPNRRTVKRKSMADLSSSSDSSDESSEDASKLGLNFRR